MSHCEVYNESFQSGSYTFGLVNVNFLSRTQAARFMNFEYYFCSSVGSKEQAVMCYSYTMHSITHSSTSDKSLAAFKTLMCKEEYIMRSECALRPSLHCRRATAI